MLFKEIDKVEFGLLSNEEIQKQAVCEITSTKLNLNAENSLYDPRLGPCDSSSSISHCVTCKKSSEECSGHFGYINLNTKILNPLLVRFCSTLLNMICLKCSRLKLTTEHLRLRGINPTNRHGLALYLSIRKELEKLTYCVHCKDDQIPKVVMNTHDKQLYQVFPQITASAAAKRKKKKSKITEQEEKEDILLEDDNENSKKDGEEEEEKEKVSSLPTKKLLTDDHIFQILDRMIDEEVQFIGFSPKRSHPRSMVLQNLPVLPTAGRPFVMSSENQLCDDDITLVYLDIIKLVNSIVSLNKNVSAIEDMEEYTKKQKKLTDILRFKIRALYDNSQDLKLTSSATRTIRSLKKRVVGKTGLIRSHLMGKRANNSARSVITGDPELKTDEVGIPRLIANTLSSSIVVTTSNIEKVKRLIRERKITYINKKGGDFRISVNYFSMNKYNQELKYGDKVYRDGLFLFEILKEEDKFQIQTGDYIEKCSTSQQENQQNLKLFFTHRNFVNLEVGDVVEKKIEDGEYLLLNRQPTLWSGSIMAMKAKILPGSSIRLPLSITHSLNADFDGDENNLHSVGKSPEAVVEIEELSSVKNFVLNCANSTSNLQLVQDSIISLHLMTLSKNNIEELPKKVFYHILSSTFDWEKKSSASSSLFYKKFTEKKKQYGYRLCSRLLFSMLLPEDFTYINQNDIDPDEPLLHIENSIVKSGAVSKSDLTTIISLIYVNYEKETSLSFISKAQFLATRYLDYKGFTCGIGDCINQNQAKIKEEIEKTIFKTQSIEKSSDNHTQKKNQNIQEIYIRLALTEARSSTSKLAKDGLSTENNFLRSVISKTKGSLMNICQINSIVGQQELSGKRIETTISNNLRSLPYFPFDKNSFLSQKELLKSRGMIFSSFLEGLDPVEYFNHGCTGREGVTDTSSKTASSGYIQRRLIKLQENHVIDYDMSIRSKENKNNHIIQYIYGNGLNPFHATLDKKKKILLPCTLSMQIDRINFEFEKNNMNKVV